MLNLHMARLAKSNEICKNICFFGCFEQAEGTNVMYWQSSSELFRALRTLSFLYENYILTNTFPTPATFSFYTPNPKWRIWPTLELASKFISACSGAITRAFNSLSKPRSNLPWFELEVGLTVVADKCNSRHVIWMVNAPKCRRATPIERLHYSALEPPYAHTPSGTKPFSFYQRRNDLNRFRTDLTLFKYA